VIAWHYGEGFPKSVNISKAIDKEAGAERKVIATKETKSGGMASVNRTNKEQGFRPNNYNEHGNKFEITESATDADKQYEGYGTALKPATELWTLAQKPISEKTIVQNILKWGTGCLNIDGCRIAFVDQADQLFAKFGRGTEILSGNYVAGKHSKSSGRTDIEANPQGRWPANVVIDPYMAEFMDQQSGKNCGAFAAVPKRNRSNNVYGKFETFGDDGASFRGDTGGASRFFYCAKPSDNERNKGFNTTELKKEFPNGNDHITVKPVSLMRWLVKLVTPKGGIMLDNFCGSGTGLIGAKMENINYVGIDMDPRNVRISEIRVNAWNPYKYVPQELFNQ
jgi:site-specific DNA-methyltransferase (adenine-specific)